jgi:lipopolysaccharide export system permease protein
VIKKLDAYIIKKFLGTFVFMILAFVIIAIIFDISENIDDFLKSDATFGQILIKYYLNFCFYFGNLLSSFIIFLTIIWFTSKLAQSEIIAMLSGGISYARIVRPYFMAAAILVVVSLLLAHFIVPMANRVKFDFEVQYLKGEHTVNDKNLHREIEPGTIVHFYKVNPSSSSGSNFSLEKWKNKKLTLKILASGASYDAEKNVWSIHNAQVRTFHSNGSESVVERARMDTILPMTLEDFGIRSEQMNTMTTPQLSAFIEEQRMSGSGKIVQFEIEKYSRTTNAFSIFVLTLIGVAIASRKSRGGTGLHLMLAVIIGFIFIFISRMASVSAMNLGVPVSIAVWVPNFLFAFVGLFLFSRAQK